MATSSDKVDFSRLRYEIRKHWWWFIASFAAMMAIAAVYMLKNNPEFKFHADIMNEQEEGYISSVYIPSCYKRFHRNPFSQRQPKSFLTGKVTF